MSSDVDQIKDKLSIVEVVSPYVKLEKSGKNLKGKSPFNVERTPSFFVDPDQNLFHCFSSGKGGDIFTFIQELENVDFQGALKILADRAGVTLSNHNKGKSDERTKLYNIVEIAAKLYEVSFRKDKQAVMYMEDRGLTRDTMKEFRIGYAPAGWQYLVDALKEKGFSDDLIIKAGLGVQGKKGVYDRFRERIMFPINDGQGRVVAFTGRIFVKSDSDTDPKGTGKYVNSPETPIYHKSKILYGFDKAKRSIMQEDKCIVVEGQMDLIMSHQAGVTYSVALSGTALTDEQVTMIQRFTDNIVLALDTDTAGIAAVKRSVDVAYEHDLTTSVVAMGGAKDPADMVKEDPEEWRRLVSTSVDYIDFRLQTVSSGTSLREKTKIVTSDIFPSLARMKSAVIQDAALQKVAHFLGVSIEALRDDFMQWERGTPTHSVALNAATHSTVGGEDTHLQAQEQKSNQQQPAFEKQLLAILTWQASKDTPLVDVATYKEKYQSIVGEVWFNKVWEQAQQDANRLIFEASLRYDGFSAEYLIQEITQLIHYAELRALEKQQNTLTQQLRRAESVGDDQASFKLLQQHQELTKRIDELHDTFHN